MIDVIVPVYEGFEQTRRCLETVLATLPRERAELVLVDDATPNAQITRLVSETQARGVTVLRNEANAGFVRSVNRAMALHPERDVVLLNSDTEVANDWLDRLAAAGRDDRVATATPFSNNATICSYPYEGWDGGLPGTLGIDGLDGAAAKANAGVRREIPTGVGFCMFVRRAALRAVGEFDAERFGRGYGEENDFCMRASAAGWRHVLAADVFVYHEGGASFAGERGERLAAAQAALLEVHPEYGGLVQRFIVADALADLRQAIDRERAASGTHELRAVLGEHARERGLIRGRLQALETELGHMHEALAHATRLVGERTEKAQGLERLVHEREAARAREAAELEAGLRNAERLAFGRLAELERIRAFWMWRWYERALRWSARPSSG
jgi:GT2 family glycosyltransferase